MRNMKWLMGLFLALGLSAWASDEMDQTAATSENTLTDPQIAQVAWTAHSIDLDRARFAQSKVKSQQVKQFTQNMIKDHQAGKKDVAALAKKLGIKLQPSPTSKGLDEEATRTLADLKDLSGAAFEKAYIDSEVSFHQAVIDTINDTLLPATKNPQLKRALLDTVPVLESHLQHAKDIQQSLGRSS